MKNGKGGIWRIGGQGGKGKGGEGKGGKGKGWKEKESWKQFWKKGEKIKAKTDKG